MTDALSRRSTLASFKILELAKLEDVVTKLVHPNSQSIRINNFKVVALLVEKIKERQLFDLEFSVLKEKMESNKIMISQ